MQGLRFSIHNMIGLLKHKNRIDGCDLNLFPSLPSNKYLFILLLKDKILIDFLYQIIHIGQILFPKV